MQLPAKATFDEAAALAAALPEQVRAGSGVFRVDASALGTPGAACDSATIALLLQARRQAEAAGRGFAVAGAPEKLLALARLYGVEELLALADKGSASSASSASIRPGTPT
jgi:phospholipid transport system transporter-binding protein